MKESLIWQFFWSRQEGEMHYLSMSIPNSEISYIYRNTILAWFDKKIGKTDMTPLMKAIETGDGEAFGDFKVWYLFFKKGCMVKKAK